MKIYFYIIVFLQISACSLIPIKFNNKQNTNKACFIDQSELKDLARLHKMQFLDNEYYDAIYDNSKVQPFLIEYKIKYSKITHTLERGIDYSDRFIKDNRVIQSATDKDYLRTGWDKGHLAPAEDFSFSVDAAKETFLFSNISPQSPKFNRHGSWVKLERKVRELASLIELQIITGPLDFSINRMPSSVKSPFIPRNFYKILIYKKNESCFYEVFNLENDPQSQDFCIDNLSKDLPIFFSQIKINRSYGNTACNSETM